ncbi:MAG: large conductance mechanosensitive channel protein MscL [Candidatus Dormiibacterota bacterium]
MSGFKQFLLRGNLVDMAVGIVIGVAFGTLVQALIKDLITPLIAAIGGQPDFSTLSFTLNKSKFLYGDFIDALIAFVVLAAVVYFFVVRPFSSFAARFTPAPEPEPAMRDCLHCLTQIPAAATRRAHCTSELTPAPA